MNTYRIADWLGRRWAMTSECGIFIVGVIVQISASHSWPQFAAGRLISGLGIGALSAAVPMVSTQVATDTSCPINVAYFWAQYQAETAPPQIRGALTTTYQLFITLGILIACTSQLSDIHTLPPLIQLTFLGIHRLLLNRHTLHLRVRLLAHCRGLGDSLAYHPWIWYSDDARVAQVAHSQGTIRRGEDFTCQVAGHPDARSRGQQAHSSRGAYML